MCATSSGEIRNECTSRRRLDFQLCYYSRCMLMFLNSRHNREPRENKRIRHTFLLMQMEMEMRAGEEIEIGQDITPPLTPLSFALHDSFLHSHCSSCFSRLPKSTPPFLPTFPRVPHLVPTPTLLYCSSLCSSSHFSSAEFHVLQSSTSTSDLRAALRVLRTLPTSLSLDNGRIFGLLTNREKLMTDDEISTRVRDGVRAMMTAVRMMNGNGNGNESQSDAVLLEAALCLVLTNAVEVQDKEGCTLGIAVYGPNFSWINHSCSPNACYRFLISSSGKQLPPFPAESRLLLVPSGSQGEKGVHSNFEFAKGCFERGPRVIVRSIKRMNKGEEVTLAYTDLLQPKAMRQSELWSKYRFICCCPRCSASPPSYVDYTLQEVSALIRPSSSLSSNHSFYRDEATRKLTDYVDEVITEYLTVGDPKSCCKKLESMLILGLLHEQLETTKEGKSQLYFRLHPLHHLALSAFMTLASAYKVRASDLLAVHPEVDRPQLEDFNMIRTSAAYSLLLAAATHHLFCFESSLIASVSNFWTSAGESLLTLARSSGWGSLGKLGLSVSNMSSLGKHKCPRCSVLDRFEANLFLSQGQNADFESISSSFLACITSFSQKVWSFLIHGCDYLKKFKDPIDFSWLGKSSNIWDFEVNIFSNHIDSNCSISESISVFEVQGYSDQGRINIFLLGAHCLLYGGFLASVCYGPHSRWTSHIQSILYYEGD